MKEYTLSKHALIVIGERGISMEWVDRVIQNPKKVEADPIDSSAIHHLGAIEEYGNRVLRMILNEEAVPARVISVFFDRKMKGKL